MQSGRHLTKGFVRNGMRKYLSRTFEYMEEISHMDELRKSQATVFEVKNQLRNIGDEKRDIMQQLDEVRRKQNDIYSEMKLVNSRSGSSKYLDLVMEELKTCELEKTLHDKYVKADTQEKKLFDEFTGAITDSYEKEKIHSHFLKMLGLFGTALATFFSLVNHFWQQGELRRMRMEVQSSMSAGVIKELQSMNGRLSILEKLQGKSSSPESWGSYLNRHTRWTYSWMFSKR